MSAISLYGAIVTALYQRQISGKGSYVGSSLLANGAWQNGCYLQAALCGAKIRPLRKRANAWNPLNTQYRCSDERWFSITISPSQQTRLWPEFARIMENKLLQTEARFQSYESRNKHNAELVTELDHAFAKHSAAQWRKRFKGTGIVVSIVARCEDAAQDEQMKANDILVPMEGEPLAPMTVSGPFFIKGMAKRKAQRAPEVGQHTDAVLREQGLSDAQIDSLRQAKVIQ